MKYISVRAYLAYPHPGVTRARASGAVLGGGERRQRTSGCGRSKASRGKILGKKMEVEKRIFFE
jgi:hypothetical protein